MTRFKLLSRFRCTQRNQPNDNAQPEQQYSQLEAMPTHQLATLIRS